MAKIMRPPKTAAQLKNIPDRFWLKSDRGVIPVAFYPFRDYYGGYLVYDVQVLGMIKRFKQWIGNSTARKLNVKEVYVYGRKAT